MCGICNQLFSLPSTLDKHMYVHLNKSFTCETCGMQFSFLSQLEYHKTVHKTIELCMCLSQMQEIIHVKRQPNTACQGSWQTYLEM